MCWFGERSLSGRFAEVAELADAHGSGPCGSNTLWVRLPSSASAKAKNEKFFAFFVYPKPENSMKISKIMLYLL